jgi:hypothetical protein
MEVNWGSRLRNQLPSYESITMTGTNKKGGFVFAPYNTSGLYTLMYE